MSKISLKNCLVSFAVLLMMACASMQPLQNVQDQNQFIQSVVANNPQIRTLKTKAKIEVTTKEKTYRFKTGIMMTNAQELYMETYGMGVPQSYASMTGDRLTVVMPSQKEMYVGTGASSLTNVLRVNVTMNEFFDPILKRITIAESAPPSFDMTSNHYLIRDAEKTTFYVNDQKWIDKIERRMGYLVEYGDPISSKIRFPKSIRLSYEHQSIKMTFDDVEINQPITYEALQLTIPTEGFHVSPI